jgi:acyl-CoA synthetase (AMP-forming)/AMP-acid ligase II
MVCPYPLFHMGAWTIALQQWQARDRVVFVESTDAVTICDAVERHQATRLNCIPAIWRRILDYLASPAGKNRNLASVRFADSGTSATPLELLEAIEAALPGACIRVFYGSTEAGSVASLEHADIRRKPGSCGVPAPSTEVRTEASGELWVRGPLLFDGYLGDADATAAALVDGWYRTGDLADIDEEGYLTIVGRAVDVIRTGGETVAPAEVEAVLSTHESVADVAVVGLPDQVWGEIVTAVIVLDPAAPPPTVDDLRRHCEGRLAAFKHPRRMAVVDFIPRTSSTSQVQRRLLIEQLG